MRFILPLGVLACLISLSTARTFTVGASHCVWDPEYQCKGFKEARECGATEYCIAQVWSQKNVPEDDDDVCTICKNMVKEARDTLRSNETQEELKEVFHGSCKLIPVDIIAEECIKLTDEFIVELIETLSSEMDPTLVCSTAGLCNSERIDKILAAYYHFYPRQTECDVCKAQSASLSRKFRLLPKDQLIDKLLEACGYMSSYSDACQLTVLDNYDLIAAGLANIEDGLCHLSGMCSESFANQLATYTRGSSEDVECEFCEKIIKHWVDTWTANTTEEEFKSVMEALCKKLRSPSRVDHCIHIVDDWYIPWFNFLMHEVDPHAICSYIGLCGNQGFMKVSPMTSITVLLDHVDSTQPRQLPMTEIGPAQGIGAEDYSEDDVQPTRLVGGYFMSETMLELNKPGCVICEYVMNKLVQYLGTNRTEEAIEKKLGQICQKFSKSVENQCFNFVSNYAPALVQSLQQEMDPSEICIRLFLCTDNLLLQQAQLPPEIAILRRSSDNCALCEYAMDEVYSFLNDTSDQEMVKNVLDTLCYHLPHVLSNECEKLVAEYGNALIDAIVKSSTPEEACQAIKMCALNLSLAPMPRADEKCVLCEYAITTLDKLIGDKHNEEEIKQALEHLCSHLPASIQPKCIKFVDDYSELIIELITKDMTPDEICQELGLCPSSNAVFEKESNEYEESEDDRPYCTLCEYAIGEVDKMITDRQNEDEIKHALDSICYVLSQPIQKECVRMVNQYTDAIIDMFVAEYTPEQVCAELRLCNKPQYEDELRNDLITNEIAVSDDESEEVESNPLCVICEFSMSVLEKHILNNRTLDMVEHAVQMLCSYLPQRVAEPCEDFIDEYGDEIIHLIVDSEFNPQEVCAQLRVCPEPMVNDIIVTNDISSEDYAPIGGDKCTWGPSFWCASRFHAVQCGTVAHCEKYVWN